MVLLTVEEVAKHSKEEDCWLIVHGKVYNVTTYLEDHPGGVEIVTDVGGQDASEDYDDVGHSDEAHDILKEYYIGDLNSDSEDPNKIAENHKVKATGSVKVQLAPMTPQDNTNYFLYAGAAAAVAVIGYYLLRK